MFYTFKKQYFRWLFPGSDDKDHSRNKIAPLAGHGQVADFKITVKRELHPLNLIPWIRAGINARKYDLILLPWWTIFWAPHYLLFLGIVKSSKSKIIFLCHNVEEHEGNRLKRMLTKIVLKSGDGFVLHSLEERNKLFKLLEKKCSSVVSPHPVYNVFDYNRYTRSISRQKLDISHSRKVILFFGFIRRYKGLQYLLRALPIIKEFDPDILLLIVGEIWGRDIYREEILHMIKKLKIENNIRFINQYIPNEDVEIYFKASDFTVLPYTEGTGSGILQVCYGMNKPVVATAIGTFKEVIKNGKTGLTVPPGDENKLAEAIIYMYESDCIKGMESEIMKAQKQYGWDLMVKRIIGLFETISGH
jgi:glycosyltransferase involved in cell wall biosynthesis